MVSVVDFSRCFLIFKHQAVGSFRANECEQMEISAEELEVHAVKAERHWTIKGFSELSSGVGHSISSKEFTLLGAAAFVLLLLLLLCCWCCCCAHSFSRCLTGNRWQMLLYPGVLCAVALSVCFCVFVSFRRASHRALTDMTI